MPTNLSYLCSFTKTSTTTKSQSSSSSSPLPPQNHHSRPSPLLFKNFNSLYDTAPDSDSDHHHHHHHSAAEPPPPNFATAVASQRFFFSSPGRSNSIIDSSSSSSSTSSSLASTSSASNRENEVVPAAADGSIAVPTYSPDPFSDFRRSMQEMVEARGLHDVRESWGYLHELLLCYLTLNPKCTHKFILGAFADLLVSLTTAPAAAEKGKLKVSRRRV